MPWLIFPANNKKIILFKKKIILIFIFYIFILFMLEKNIYIMLIHVKLGFVCDIIVNLMKKKTFLKRKEIKYVSES